MAFFPHKRVESFELVIALLHKPLANMKITFLSNPFIVPWSYCFSFFYYGYKNLKLKYNVKRLTCLCFKFILIYSALCYLFSMKYSE